MKKNEILFFFSLKKHFHLVLVDDIGAVDDADKGFFPFRDEKVGLVRGTNGEVKESAPLARAAAKKRLTNHNEEKKKKMEIEKNASGEHQQQRKEQVEWRHKNHTMHLNL